MKTARCYRGATKRRIQTAAFSLAFVLLSGGALQAGEKPFPKTPAPSAEKMQACPEYGPGFFRPPGSGTCIKIGGRVRGETTWGSARDRRSDATQWRSRGEVSIETRTGTDYGQARAVMRVKGQKGADSF